MGDLKLAHESLWKRESEFLQVLSAMERRGVLIDQDLCRREIAIGDVAMLEAHTALGDINPASTKQLGKLLLTELGLPVVKLTPAGNPSFDQKAMAEYDDYLTARQDKYGDVAKNIIKYRGWQKQISAFYTPYLRFVSTDGRLRCQYNPARVVTSRLSSSDPNLQQIPKAPKDLQTKRWKKNTKKSFRAKPGFSLLNCDYSQVEFRLGSAYAKQENLLEAFNSKVKRDVFDEMSQALDRDRQDCKTLTYAKLYNAGVYKIAMMLGEDLPDWVTKIMPNPTLNWDIWKEAKAYVLQTPAGQFYQSWESEYPHLVRLAEQVAQLGDSRGWIKYWSGRRRHFEKKGQGKHLAFNSLIQGGGAEIVKSAMIRLFREVDNPDCQMVLQVHDSVLFEVKTSMVEYYASIIQDVMSRVEDEMDFGVHFATEWELWA